MESLHGQDHLDSHNTPGKPRADDANIPPDLTLEAEEWTKSDASTRRGCIRAIVSEALQGCEKDDGLIAFLNGWARRFENTWRGRGFGRWLDVIMSQSGGNNQGGNWWVRGVQ